MKLSIITPHWEGTNAYIEEAYDSLRNQLYRDWEWIIVLNNGGELPISFRSDPRIWPIHCDSDKIGALKRAGCDAAQGDLFVELDADDILWDDALLELAMALEGDADIGFMYSNSARFQDETWESPEYDSRYGWKRAEVQYRGHLLTEHIAFPAGPTSLRSIWWAPNHVRAWTREAYYRAGGHNPEMAVCDDYDLVLRTYLTGAKMWHINSCLYLYRERADQTFRTRNKEIQEENKRLYARRIIPLVCEWARREQLIMLDLGAAHNPAPGHVGLDLANSDMLCDLRNDLPFPDSSVGVVRAYDILEHLPNPIHAMNEVYRVLVPGGWLLASIPSTDGRGAFQDPTHKSFWNENSLLYYTRPEQQRYVPEITARFQNARTITWYPSKWHEEHKISYVDSQLIALKEGYWDVGECPGENPWRH